MSGGHFNYNQFQLEEIAYEIDALIENKNYQYPKDITEKFNKVSKALRVLRDEIHAIDLLVCGDSSEDSFRECFNNIESFNES